MRGIKWRRPSPALVISLVALFVALGGTSYSAVSKLLPRNSVGSAQVINGSLGTSDLSSKARAALKGNRGPAGAPGVAGPQGATGPAGANGTNGTNGATGATGPAGAAGTARAYAEVDDSTVTFVAARTKNFTAVTRPSTGTYCLTPAAGIDPSAVATVAAVDYGISSNLSGNALVRGSRLGCPAGNFEVETVDSTGALVNTIAFHLIIP